YMCQTNVVLNEDGNEKLLLENVTALKIVEGGLQITTLFEGQKEFSGMSLDRIDFNEGKVYLFKS
ncbi:CooT family nickel-binding protein, partial [Desulfomarina sp.]